jgi:undecaprenyl-diphosphatase
MSFWQVVFLSIIQGLTEFLPISSSGHLVIFQKLFGLYPPVVFDVMVHVGTLGAVIVFLRKRLLKILQGVLKGKTKSARLLRFLIVGSLPALIFGLILEPYLEVIFNC